MTTEPTNPRGALAVTVADLLADLALIEQSYDAEPGEPMHPNAPGEDDLFALEQAVARMLAHRSPATAGEALAMAALAFNHFATALEGIPLSKAWVERGHCLLRMALPALDRAIADQTPAVRAIVSREVELAVRQADAAFTPPDEAKAA